jgi:cysteine desulfurase / selenocysteine lyase
MSTPELDQAADLAGVSVDAFEPTSAALALPGGPPLDVSVLARMANEMFRAIPGLPAPPASIPASIPASMPASVPSASNLTTSLPGVQSVPTSFAGMPASPAAAAVPTSAAPLPMGATPGFAGESDLRALAGFAQAPLANPLAAAPGFPSFLDPSASSMGSMGAPFVAGALPGFPGEADLRALVGLAQAPLADPITSASAPSFYFLRDAEELTKAAVATAAPITAGSGEIVPEVVPSVTTGGIFDAASIRRDFPILSERVNGRPLVWLDNAATTQKPRAVIERLSRFYEHENSNIHRAAHTLAARSTDAYEAAREAVRRFLNASSVREIVFVRGTTEGINLVAQSWGGRHVGEGDEIILTRLEHHSNIVPWQLLCAQKGAKLRVAPIDDTGQILLDEYERLFTPRTRLVSLAHVSNALGTVTPVREMVAIAHRHGALALVDGAQAVSHMRVDVQSLDCDFYVFSGHKVFAPTGIGAVYGKEEALASMPPWQGGGNMIVDVTFEKTVYQPAPMRFEAGTGNIADAAGLGAALDYLMGVGLENVTRHEHELLVYATREMLTVPGLRLVGTAREKAGVLSFVLDGFRSEDVGKALDAEGIAVRAGHHCAQPALRRFGLESSVRPSLALYNTCDDIDALIDALRRLQSGRGPVTSV